ncbi:MAG: magnesium transporter MgtE N-terminal domain-containing protein [Myxococcales bacterium]
MSASPESPFGILFFSELLGRRIVASDGVTIGRLVDLVVVPGEPYPPIESLVYETPQRGRFLLPWTAVARLVGNAIHLRAGLSPEPLPEVPAADRLRLAEEILDRQIVDVEGAKVVRVNDLNFVEAKGALRLAHVDVGFRGLVRRMGWQRAVDFAVRGVRPGARYLHADAFLPWKLVQPLGTAPGKVRVDIAQRQLAELHPADLAEIMEDLDRYQRVTLFKRLDVETAAEALEESSPEVTSQLIHTVPPDRAADILEEMAPDEAADVLGELSPEARAEILQRMERPEAREVQALLGYDPGSAGGLMTPDLVRLPATASAADALAEVRRRAEELPFVYEIFVAEAEGPLHGLCTLKDLVASDPATPLGKLLREAPATVRLEADARELAEVAAKYNLISVPVVDEAGVLRGMVAVDDILARVLHGS